MKHQCMGFRDNGGVLVIDGHEFESDRPSVPKSTGLCPGCRDKYLEEINMSRKLIPESLDMSEHEDDYKNGRRSWAVLGSCNWKSGERIPVIGAAGSVIGVAQIVSHSSCYRWFDSQDGPQFAEHRITFNAVSPIRLSNSLSSKKVAR